MISRTREEEAFVWTWLPGADRPVVAGRLSRDGSTIVFDYDRGYLVREGAVALYGPELPLRPGIQPLPPGLSMPSCIRDASPDAWGRRVVAGRLRSDGDPGALDELACLLGTGSDRIGALDFQRSSTVYEPRDAGPASLEQLLAAAECVDRGRPLSQDLDEALRHAAAVGGARPKALIQDDGAGFVAKFPAVGDVSDLVKAEFVAMRLARAAGLDVAEVSIRKVGVREILLVRRFDRQTQGARRSMVSALTIFGLDEMMARYASYEDLCTAIRHRFERPTETLRELFGRLVFNILVGNTDDHARNHAAFWDGARLKLTPAYDICPQGRSGNEASQAMLISGSDRRSQLASCRNAAPNFRMSEAEADDVVVAMVEAVRASWNDVCEEAELPRAAGAAMWRRQILNPYAFEGLPGHLASLAA